MVKIKGVLACYDHDSGWSLLIPAVTSNNQMNQLYIQDTLNMPAYFGGNDVHGRLLAMDSRGRQHGGSSCAWLLGIPKTNWKKHIVEESTIVELQKQATGWMSIGLEGSLAIYTGNYLHV